MSFKPLPQARRHDGSPRRVGVEMEYAGLKIDEAALLLQETLGGHREPVNRFRQKVKETRLGDFNLELDVQVLRNETYEKYLRDLGLDVRRYDIKKEVDWFLERMTTLFLPYELVSPPLHLESLPELENIREVFYKHKAKGTSSSPVYAFGLHFNIETPQEDVSVWLRYMRAFLLLYPWLHRLMRIDLTRQATPWIDRFPPEYIERLLDRSYRPTAEEFMEDYCDQNPTRNRPLDFYSIFAQVFGSDHPRIQALELVKPRPAFHYRLPNCDIDNPQWRLATEWNRWVMVEQLAQDEERLQTWSQRYLDMSREAWFGFNDKWIKWLEAHFPQDGDPVSG